MIGAERSPGHAFVIQNCHLSYCPFHSDMTWVSVQVLGYEPKGLLSLELGVAAELTGAWTVTAPADPDAGGELLAATSGLHVYGPHFLQARHGIPVCTP